MYVCMYVCMYHCFKMKRYDFLHCFCKGGSVFLDPTLVIYKRNWNLTLTASNLQLCDIPFMRSHEARPSTQGCKSLFEVGEAILGEGAYFIIFWGAYATFSPSWKIHGGAIAPVAPPGFAPMPALFLRNLNFGAVNTAVPPVKTLGTTVSLCPT